MVGGESGNGVEHENDHIIGVRMQRTSLGHPFPYWIRSQRKSSLESSEGPEAAPDYSIYNPNIYPIMM